MSWEKSPVDSAAVRALAETYDLDLLIASILTRRAVNDPESIAFVLEEDERFLHNPFLFPDMEIAVDRVRSAAEEGEKVLVFGDKDVDGVTSTTLIVEALRERGLDPLWHVPVGDEDYGINREVVENSSGQDVTLVVAVDCGVTDFDAVARANELGMDVIILDHHMPREERLPDALAIINPKIPGSYPFDGLCAAAVASKFVWALAFAGTDLYEHTYCLLHARREGEVIVIEAARMVNLLETERIAVRSDGTDAEVGHLLTLLEGEVIRAYGGKEQEALVSTFFGGAEVSFHDVREEIAAEFPSLRGLAVDELEAKSRLARYFRDHDGPLTALRNVITTLLLRKHHDVFEGWRRGLDLVALGTLADLMPLRDENRILVRMGLERLNGNDPGRFRREALRELLVRQDLHQTRVGTTEVSWQICPLINSAGRMGKADVAARLLLEEDGARRHQLADEIVALNKKRRSLGADLWDRLQGDARESVERLGGKMLMVADPSIPRGITGILASRWSKAFGVTSVVIAIQGAGASGSVRCTGGFDVLEWMGSMSSLFEDFGGHPCAGGFRLPADQVETLEKRSAAWLAKQPPSGAPDDVLAVDAELNHESLDALGLRGLEEVLQKLEPYGEGFKPLMFLTRKVKILDADLVGKPKNNHLKLLVSLGSHKWPAFWWDAADKYGEHLRVGSMVDLVYRVDRDKWRGGDARRLTVMEAIPCRDS